MIHAENLPRFLAGFFLVGALSGCGRHSARQVEETSDQSFHDVAAMIEQENAESNDRE